MTKKTLTRLLNSTYRNRILHSKSRVKSEYILSYAEQLLDEHLKASIKRDDKIVFPGLIALEVIRENQNNDPIFIECGCVNHFLNQGDKISALDAIQCIMKLIIKEDTNIISFVKTTK